MWMTTIDNIYNYIIIDLEHYARTLHTQQRWATQFAHLQNR